MRKKQNYQKTEYSQNGELLCFGLSEHQLTEHVPSLSEKAKKDLELVQSWYAKKDELLARPAYKSNFNMTNDAMRAKLRVILGLLFIRELPIKSFTAR